jgi:PAS domain S-box-containing protein
MLLIEPESGNIIDANASAEKYYGWTVEQLVKMHIQDINIKDDNFYEDIEKERNLYTTHFETKHRRANNLVNEVEVFSSRVDIFGKEYLHYIVHDITARKEAEKLVQLLSRALEQSPVSLMITNKEGKLVYVNSKFTETTGYTFQEAILENPRFLKSDMHTADFYKTLWDTLLSGNVWHGEFRNKKKNGELYWTKSIISSITDNKGEITYFVAVHEDISELKKLNTELVIAKEKAEESDNLKTAFLHTILHEIRTPINAIVGFSEFLNYPDLTSDKRQQFIDIVIKSSHQLLSIITNIVTVATIKAGQEKVNEKEIDINTVCKLINNQYLQEAQEKKLLLNYSIELLPSETLILTDETKLSQILSNLVGNALKFTLTGYVNFGCAKKNNFIEFYVQDSGIGISPEKQEEIYKPFRQVDYSETRKFGGSGLGLTISKAYVEMLGGTIWLNSEINKGTEFCFTIPYKNIENKH